MHIGEVPEIRILGVRIHALGVEQLHAQITGLISEKAHALVLNVNAHCMNLAYQNRWLRELLNGADLVFCDGAGIMFGARILGHHIPQRITYADWIWQLAALAKAKGFTLYFLGAGPGVAERAASRLQRRFPGLRVAGTHHGYFDKTAGSPENEAILKGVNDVKPDILVVGLGMPLQERWLLENWNRIDANIALTGGAVFDYVSGILPRAPRWMTDHGLEWLGRLLIEPGRLWRRYLLGNPLFLMRVLRQRIVQPRGR